MLSVAHDLPAFRYDHGPDKARVASFVRDKRDIANNMRRTIWRAMKAASEVSLVRTDTGVETERGDWCCSIVH